MIFILCSSFLHTGYVQVRWWVTTRCLHSEGIYRLKLTCSYPQSFRPFSDWTRCGLHRVLHSGWILCAKTVVGRCVCVVSNCNATSPFFIFCRICPKWAKEKFRCLHSKFEEVGGSCFWLKIELYLAEFKITITTSSARWSGNG